MLTERPFWLSLLAALFLGAASHFAFAPYELWALLPLGLGLTLWLSQDKTPRQAAQLGLAFGFGQFALGLRWVHVSIEQFGGLPLAISVALIGLLALYLALYPAIVFWLLNRFFNAGTLQRILAFPALWLLGEWSRGKMLTGFPWLWLGYSQADGPLLSLVPWFGVLGVGLILSLLSVSIAALLKRDWRFLAIPVGVAVLTLASKAIVLPTKSLGQLDVALVQGNIEQSMKWEPQNLWPTILKYQDLSRPVMDADLIIWPEAAIPAPEVMVRQFLEPFEDAVHLRETSLITGIISADNEQRFYNSLLVMDATTPKGLVGPHQPNRYHKHQLLPIGEFVPFEDWLRPLAPLFNLPMSSFSRGDYVQTNLTAGSIKLAPAICYEIAFPELVRANLTEETDMLLTVSNDAWFGNSIGPHQHMEIARMRSAELGRPLLRVTNNGITAIVDANGKLLSQLPQFEDGVLHETVERTVIETPFARWGHLPLFVLSLAMLVIASLRTKTWARQASRQSA